MLENVKISPDVSGEEIPSIKIADGVLGIAGILELDVAESWRSASDPDGNELAVVAHFFLDFGRAWGV